MRIFIAAGHGDKEPGAVAQSTTERDEVITIVDSAVQMLKSIIKPPYDIVLVPQEMRLIEEVNYINTNTRDAVTDVALEVHLNSNAGNPGSGTETYYGLPKFAQAVHTGVVSVLGLKDRGVKDGSGLYFNRKTVCGSALVELGFINNPDDLDKVRRLGTQAIVAGIAAYVGMQLVTVQAVVPNNTEYRLRYEAEAKKLEFVKTEISKILLQV